MDAAMWQAIEEGCGLDDSPSHPPHHLEDHAQAACPSESRMVQCPFCRSAASSLCLRKPVAERQVSVVEFNSIAAEAGIRQQEAAGEDADASAAHPATPPPCLPLKAERASGSDAAQQQAAPDGAARPQPTPRCCGREGMCRRRFDKGAFFACTTSPETLLCDRCFHAFDHADLPFERIAASDSAVDGDAAGKARDAPPTTTTPADSTARAATPKGGSPGEADRQLPQVTDLRLGRLLARMPPQSLVSHIERAHGGSKKGRARCTLCPGSGLLGAGDMAVHMQSVHNLPCEGGGPFRSSGHPVTLLQQGRAAPPAGDDFIFAEGPQHRVEIRGGAEGHSSTGGGGTPQQHRRASGGAIPNFSPLSLPCAQAPPAGGIAACRQEPPGSANDIRESAAMAVHPPGFHTTQPAPAVAMPHGGGGGGGGGGALPAPTAVPFPCPTLGGLGSPFPQPHTAPMHPLGFAPIYGGAAPGVSPAGVGGGGALLDPSCGGGAGYPYPMGLGVGGVMGGVMLRDAGVYGGVGAGGAGCGGPVLMYGGEGGSFALSPNGLGGGGGGGDAVVPQGWCPSYARQMSS